MDLMLTALRLPAFLVGLGLLALGCSDARRTVLQTRPGAPENPGADGDLVLGECAGKGIDCTTDPQVRLYQPGMSAECSEMRELGRGSLLWIRPLTVVCRNAPCTLWPSFVKVLPASLIATGSLISEGSVFSGGAWFAQFSLDGSLLGERILEPGLGSRVSEDEGFTVGGTDSAGNLLVIEGLGDNDHARTTIARHTIGGERTELLTLENHSFLQSTVAADGGFALTIGYFNENISDPTNDSTLPERSPMRLDIARFDREGRLLWNQPKLGRALELTHPLAVGFDAFGNTLVKLARFGGISIRFDPGRVGSLSVDRLARVDPKGNVLWVWEFPLDAGIDAAAVMPNGGVYVLRSPVAQKPDGFYEQKPAVLELLEPTGHSNWVLSLPPAVDDIHGLSVSASGDALLTVVKEDANGAQSAHVLTVQHDSVVVPCRTFELPPEACDYQQGSTICSPPHVRAAPDGTFYFTTNSAIGQVAPP
jgi:hypothetical protein